MIDPAEFARIVQSLSQRIHALEIRETDTAASVGTLGGGLRGTLPNPTIYNEPWRIVGAGGQPAFQSTWTNYDPSSYPSCRFYKDAGEVVHLQGLLATGTNGAAVFQLPVGYRPSRLLHVQHYTASGPQLLIIGSDGNVVPNGGATWWSLSAISFRGDQ